MQCKPVSFLERSWRVTRCVQLHETKRYVALSRNECWGDEYCRDVLDAIILWHHQRGTSGVEAMEMGSVALWLDMRLGGGDVVRPRLGDGKQVKGPCGGSVMRCLRDLSSGASVSAHLRCSLHLLGVFIEPFTGKGGILSDELGKYPLLVPNLSTWLLLISEFLVTIMLYTA